MVERPARGHLEDMAIYFTLTSFELSHFDVEVFLERSVVGEKLLPFGGSWCMTCEFIGP